MKKGIFLIFAVFSCFSNVYGGGAKDIDTIDVSSKDTWTESLDVSSKKKGKYNVLITAKDIAGNEGYAGPFNMYIDPNSDLPIVQIINPRHETSISGNVNIVGTCIDDDAVDYVELRIDDDENIYRAKGKEFWSYYLNTGNLKEGTHTIEVWGVDINGVKGKSVKSIFYLNRQSPETSITNRVIGELISGKVTIEGSVEDGNGVAKLLYSLDNGETFKDVKLYYNKKTKQSNFYLKLNTNDIPDGPKVLWFKAFDKQGSIGVYTFLVFVDNTPPSLEFAYPNEGEIFPPIFSLAGRAFDSAGLESLTWTCGKEKGSFDIVPGNYYWVKEFDVSKAGLKSAVVEVTAKDIAGNIVRAKRTISIDQTKGKPVIEMVSPSTNNASTGDLLISGIVHDIYGAKEVRYRIDKGQEKSIEASIAGFTAIEKDLNAGEHILSIYAVNKKGIAGIPRTIKFIAEGMAPSITFNNNETVLPMYNARSKESTSIYVKAQAGLKYLSAAFNGAEETVMPLKTGEKEYIIKTNLSAKSEPGLYTILVTATDMNERTSHQTLAVRIVSPSEDGDEEGFVWAVSELTESKQVIMLDNKPLYGVYQPKKGAVIESVEVVGGREFEATFNGNLISLTAKNDGSYQSVGVKIRDSNGNVFTSPLINILSDTRIPNLNLEIPEEPVFIKNSIILKGRASDGAGIKTVEYSIGENTTSKILASSFNETINISSEPDGPILLKIRVVDIAGRENIAYRLFYKDNDAPEVVMILPISGDKINGTSYAAFKVTDRFSGVKAEYKTANKTADWQSFDYSTLPNIIIGSAKDPISKNMQFRFTDLAGNSRIFNTYNFEIDNSSDAPSVEIHLPVENEIIIHDFEVSGMVYDDDAVAKIYYRIDNGPYKSLDTKNSFSIPILLNELTDNEHTITIYGEDIYGVTSQPITRKIKVSSQVPSVSVASPIISDTVRDIITISGTASDKNGIKEIEISLDNGNTFNLAEGGENWKYTLNTQIINDGTHVIFIRVTDNYDQTALFSTLINIDNTPPILSLEYPLAGAKLDSNLFVSGSVNDNISLEGVSLKIKSLDGVQVPSRLAQIKIETDLIVAKDIDISALPEGRYNLEISGVDKAKNTNETSINFDIYRKRDKNRIELMYPLNGETVRGEFNVYGHIISDRKVDTVSLFVNGKEIETGAVSATGYVAFKLNPEKIAAGKCKLELRASQVGKGVIVSNQPVINYKIEGPWVTIDNFAMGDFAVDRPYLRGRAGYSISEEEKNNVSSANATVTDKNNLKLKRLKKVELSFDNGKTFVPAKSYDNWKYRLETDDMSEGNHFLLVRAVMENKEVAICRTIIKIDKTSPEVTLISPGEGGRYNNSIDFTGLALDDIELSGVQIALRSGDKSRYGLPKFIQGLHFELGFWGASLWNVGVGLSFFDDNVKLQIHYGQFLQSQFSAIYGNSKIRYGGHIASLKILANVFELPFGYYLGADWKWLYMNIALGAQFSLFTKTQSGRPQVLSAMLMQLEFPRVKFHKQKYFSSLSFFTEGQLWFIPTDVESAGKSKIRSVIPHISGGIRVDIF